MMERHLGELEKLNEKEKESRKETDDLVYSLKKEGQEREERNFRKELRREGWKAMLYGIGVAVGLPALLGASVLMIVGGIGGANYYLHDRKKILEGVNNLQTYQLVVQDINNNGIPEKFYEINGKKIFLEIDGENLEKKILEQQK